MLVPARPRPDAKPIEKNTKATQNISKPFKNLMNNKVINNFFTPSKNKCLMRNLCQRISMKRRINASPPHPSKCKRRFQASGHFLSLSGELIFRKGAFPRKWKEKEKPLAWLGPGWWDWNVADTNSLFSKVNAMFAKGALIGGISSLFVAGWVAVGSQQAIASGSLSFQTKPMSVDGCSYSYPPNNSTLNDK